MLLDHCMFPNNQKHKSDSRRELQEDLEELKLKLDKEHRMRQELQDQFDVIGMKLLQCQ